MRFTLPFNLLLFWLLQPCGEAEGGAEKRVAAGGRERGGKERKSNGDSKGLSVISLIELQFLWP